MAIGQILSLEQMGRHPPRVYSHLRDEYDAVINRTGMWVAIERPRFWLVSEPYTQGVTGVRREK